MPHTKTWDGKLSLSTDNCPTNKALAVKGLFDSISPTYDRLNHVLSFNIDKIWRKKSIARIQKSKEENFLALDLCCGTHDMGIECIKQFPNAKITAMDFSAEMLKAGEPKIKKYIASGQIKTLVGDALDMPFPEASFDVIFCAYGLRNFSDTQKGLAEMRRVLKPGGQLLILDFFKPQNFFTRVFHQSYAQHVLPRLGGWISGRPEAYVYLRDSIAGFVSTPQLLEMLKRQGFPQVCSTDFFGGISSCVEAL